MKKTTVTALTAMLLVSCLTTAAPAIAPPKIINGKYVSLQEVQLSAKQKMWTVQYRAKCPQCGTVSENLSSGIYAPKHVSRDPNVGKYSTVCEECGAEFQVTIVQK